MNEQWQQSEDLVKQKLLDLIADKNSSQRFKVLNEVDTKRLLEFKSVTTQIVSSLKSQLADARRRYREKGIKSNPSSLKEGTVFNRLLLQAHGNYQCHNQTKE